MLANLLIEVTAVNTLHVYSVCEMLCTI